MLRRRFLQTAALCLFAAWKANAHPQEPPRPGRVAVTSSSIASIGYEPARRELDIEFRSGVVYRYGEVPERVFRQFLESSSKGRYFTQHIRDNFRFRRLSEPTR